MTDPHAWQAAHWTAPGPPAPVTRPGQATAAAVLAFVQAGLLLVLVLAVTVTALADDVPGADVGIAVLVVLAACTVAALDLLGGLLLLRGAGRTLLLVTSWVEAGLLGLVLLAALVDLADGPSYDPTRDAVALLLVVVLLALPVARLLLLTRPPVAAWVAGWQRARTGPPVWAPYPGQWVPGPAAPAAPSGVLVASLVPAGVLALVATVAITVGGTTDLPVEAFGHTGSGSPSDPPSPGDPAFDLQFDGDARDCQAGDMAACDDLYLETPVDDPYETYGSTCGGRLDDETYGGCVGVFGPTD
ncbi:hypothetical protein ACI79J_08965 [Geodermatophilus sp. SYSU D01062]